MKSRSSRFFSDLRIWGPEVGGRALVFTGKKKGGRAGVGQGPGRVGTAAFGNGKIVRHAYMQAYVGAGTRKGEERK